MTHAHEKLVEQLQEVINQEKLAVHEVKVTTETGLELYFPCKLRDGMLTWQAPYSLTVKRAEYGIYLEDDEWRRVAKGDSVSLTNLELEVS